VHADGEDWLAQREEKGFPRTPDDECLRVYTTRPDTLCGATYMVLSPEHPFISRLTTKAQQEAVEAYCRQAANKSDLERTELAKEKTGVFTGSYAVNPVVGSTIPIWIADYVLSSYGTGAIMSVPAHDTRDFEFAKKYDLPIQAVVMPPMEWFQELIDQADHTRQVLQPLAHELRSMNKLFGDINGMTSEEVTKHVCDTLLAGLAKSFAEDRLCEQTEEAEGTGKAKHKCKCKEEGADECQCGGQCRCHEDEEAEEENDIFTEELHEYLREISQEDDFDTEKAQEYLAICQRVADWIMGERESLEAEDLAVVYVDMAGGFETPFTGEGTTINCNDADGLSTADFKQEITEWLTQLGIGKAAVNYKLRDWLFSRQRFWGEPFPILKELDKDGNETGVLRAVDADQLPVDLPHLDDYKPLGRPEPPLEKAPEDWLYVELDGKRYKRETNTMPQWAGSCWYFLRFIDPKNDQAMIDPEKEKAWMPVDLYVGGAEHAVLHLLYARFWHKVLYDRGYVSTLEPFQRLVNQGMILGEVEEADGRAYKMSKSRGNVINPDEIVNNQGADSLRLYEMFMGPLEATKPWSMAGVSGVRNFLDRCWRLIVDQEAEEIEVHEAVQDVACNDEQTRVLHQTIKAVTQDVEKMEFNTGIARMMEFVNFFTKQTVRPKEAMESLVLMLSPYAPHIAEELWQILGHDDTLAYHPWPQYDEAKTKEDTLEIPVQIKGKLRSLITVPADISKDDLEAAAKADPKIASILEGKEIVKAIVVPGRMVNFVVK